MTSSALRPIWKLTNVKQKSSQLANRAQWSGSCWIMRSWRLEYFTYLGSRINSDGCSKGDIVSCIKRTMISTRRETSLLLMALTYLRTHLARTFIWSVFPRYLHTRAGRVEEARDICNMVLQSNLLTSLGWREWQTKTICDNKWKIAILVEVPTSS